MRDFTNLLEVVFCKQFLNKLDKHITQSTSSTAWGVSLTSQIGPEHDAHEEIPLPELEAFATSGLASQLTVVLFSADLDLLQRAGTSRIRKYGWSTSHEHTLNTVCPWNPNVAIKIRRKGNRLLGSIRGDTYEFLKCSTSLHTQSSIAFSFLCLEQLCRNCSGPKCVPPAGYGCECL